MAHLLSSESGNLLLPPTHWPSLESLEIISTQMPGSWGMGQCNMNRILPTRSPEE